MKDIFKKPFIIQELYPDKLNIYGDSGNFEVIRYRLEKYGFKTESIPYKIGSEIAENADFILAGGGQDSSQLEIANDLLKNKESLKRLAEDGVSMLAICGAYQLFGNSFLTKDADLIEGLGIFNLETKATDKRLIGNIETLSKRFGRLIGYENHSGQTTLLEGQLPLSETVVKGFGNDSKSGIEGAIYKNCLGTYLHGPFLPKNPKVADFLINCAINRRLNKDVILQSNEIDLTDSIANKAREVAFSRP